MHGKQFGIKAINLLAFFGTFAETNSIFSQSYTYQNCTIADTFSNKAQTCGTSSPEFLNKYNKYQWFIDNHTNIPIQTIPINFVFWTNGNPTDNWQNTPAQIARLHQIAAWIDGIYSNLCPPSDPRAGVPFTTDSRIRFKLNAIHFNTNSLLWGSASALEL
jgi:hypothetical protein